jgi:hypothetical protein
MAGLTGAYAIAASQIVVRPWYGQHEVYGIFVVPDKLKNRKYSMFIRVADYRREIVRDETLEVSRVAGITAPPGKHVKRIFLPTRIAFRYLIAGRLGMLKAPDNWTLLFLDRTTGSTSPND